MMVPIRAYSIAVAPDRAAKKARRILDMCDPYGAVGDPDGSMAPVMSSSIP
jgi:hypothetical protein